ncbi:transcriptional regulator, AraC family [Pseudomonas delhiensis]|uniref:Transcriptional regulator, AraC family n=1 Tax=Pseudomonas delhiensis TaxID=366289 RepID=A0A239IZY8_9PSED|nr:transcriptional regulator, AraC family [Pseudomonas delhiensis]SNS99095.1 transcriptional regulator, AraC family [Pseudomonas delhiensis]
MLSSLIRSVCQTLRGYGLDPIELMEAAGLETRLLNVPEARYDGEAVKRFWRLAIRATGDALLGLRVGKELQAPALHSLGLALMASGSLAQLLELFANYSRLVCTSLHIELYHERKRTRVILHTDEDDIRQRPLSLAILAFINRQACSLAQHPVIPLRVTSVMAAGPQVRALDAYFGTDVCLGAECDSIAFHYENVIEPYAGGNPQLVQVNEELINGYLSHLREHDVFNRVRAHIQRMLATGEPPLGQVARVMNLSPRTLQRRLDDAGCCYKQLVDNGRKEMAYDLLAHSETSVTEISFLLGFSDPSNFNRACHRWFDCSPQQFRQRMLCVTV